MMHAAAVVLFSAAGLRDASAGGIGGVSVARVMRVMVSVGKAAVMVCVSVLLVRVMVLIAMRMKAHLCQPKASQTERCE